MARILAVQSITWTDAGWADALRLLADAGHEVSEWGSLDGPGPRAALRSAEGLFVEVTPVPAQLIEAAPQLLVIGKGGVGLDSIDRAAAARAGVRVCNTPGSNSECVADHTFALLLALTRRLRVLDGATRSGNGWNPWPPAIGEELTGKAIGVIGAGNSGRAVIRRAQAFGLRVMAYDTASAPLDGFADVEATTLPDLLARADVVTVHVPLVAETTGLIGPAQLAAMRAGSYLVNVSRGGIVDEAALLAALDSGHLAGAGIDVFATEPATNSPLFAHERVIVTPHAAGISTGSIARSRIATAHNLISALAVAPDGGPPGEPGEPGHAGEEADLARLRRVDLAYFPTAIVPATARRWLESTGQPA